MNKENVITIIALVIVVVALGYAVSLVNKPASGIIASLTQPPLTQKEQEEQKTITPEELDALLTKEGLVRNDIMIGEGKEAKAGDTIAVHYEGTFPDGTKFDSSYDRGELFELTIGAGKVIPGWELGLLGMKVGGKRKLIIPPHFAYGEQGQGPIPPNTALYFTVELVENRGSPEEQLINLSE